MNRGLSVVASAAVLLGRELTEEELLHARILGWCVEWVRAQRRRRDGNVRSAR